MVLLVATEVVSLCPCLSLLLSGASLSWFHRSGADGDQVRVDGSTVTLLRGQGLLLRLRFQILLRREPFRSCSLGSFDRINLLLNTWEMYHRSLGTGGLKNNLNIPLVSILLYGRELLILPLPDGSVTGIELHTLIFHASLVLLISFLKEFFLKFYVIMK